MMKTLFLSLCVTLLCCQFGCQLGVSKEGEIIGHVDIKDFNAVKIFELDKRIFILGSLEPFKLTSEELSDYASQQSLKVESVVYELVNGQPKEIARSPGRLADALLIDNGFCLVKNLDSGVVEIDVVMPDGKSKKIGSIKGRCRKFQRNKAGFFILILSDRFVVTKDFVDLFYEKKFTYIGHKHSKIYSVDNKGFMFLSGENVCEFNFKNKEFIQSRNTDIESIYLDNNENKIYKVIGKNKNKSEVQLWRDSRLFNSFEVDLMLVSIINVSDIILIGGSTSTFGSRYCVYTMNGEKVRCFKPRLGQDWPYFVTDDNIIISYSSTMVQKIDISSYLTN